MSVSATEGDGEPEGFELPNDPASAMGELMGFLSPEAFAEAAAEGDPPADPPGTDGGSVEPPAEGAQPGGGSEPPAADGAGGEPPVSGGNAGTGGEPAASGTAAVVAPGTVDAESIKDEWGKISQAFEDNQTQYFKDSALSEVREEYGKYFDSIQQHPRTLVGQEVPSLKGEGMERLKDSADARDWQEAVKQQLAAEVQSRVTARGEEFRDTFETIHSSIDLFRNNHDLIPYTKQFNKELADRFAGLAKDYELRSNGKLVGYSVPVQPLINQLRTQLASQAKPAAAPAQPSARQQQAATQARQEDGRWDGPQAGIGSKAGRSGNATDDPAAGLMEAFMRQNGMGGASL